MRTLFRVLIFLLPTQLAFHFWPSWAFVYGIRVDYLSPAIYLVDILLAGLICVFLVKKIRLFTLHALKYWLLIIGVVVFIVLNVLSSQVLQVAVIGWLKTLELVLFVYVVRNGNFRFTEDFLTPLSWSLLLVSFVGISQFLISHTTGLFYFLGERSFSKFMPGIATREIFGTTYLRSYSIFSHPNSLAGFLLVGLFFLAQEIVKARKNKLLYSFALVVSFVTLVTSLSLAGVIIFVFLSILFVAVGQRRKLLLRLAFFVCFTALIISMLSPVIFSELVKYSIVEELPKSVYQRADLSVFAGSLFSSFPLIGVGLNNFIIKLPQSDVVLPITWLLQPVHNIFLLVVSETGLVGLAFFFLMLCRGLRSSLIQDSPYSKSLAFALLVIVLTGLVDHYWLTLQQNQLLLAATLGYSFKK